MAREKLKQISMIIFSQEHVRRDWFFDFDGETFQNFYSAFAKEMKKLGISLLLTRNSDSVVTVNSYADLLNAVRISSPEDGHSNLCLGHIIGKSEHLDILEDIRAAVRRVAFAPETIAPSTEFRKVCHNCGCGC